MELNVVILYTFPDGLQRHSSSQQMPVEHFHVLMSQLWKQGLRSALPTPQTWLLYRTCPSRVNLNQCELQEPSPNYSLLFSNGRYIVHCYLCDTVRIIQPIMIMGKNILIRKSWWKATLGTNRYRWKVCWDEY